MLDLTRDPKKSRAASNAIEAGQNASSVEYLSERKMRNLIRELAQDSGIFGIPARKLTAQGLHAEHVLLEALSNPEFLLLKPVTNHTFDSTPAATAIHLLSECGSTQSLDTLRYLMTVEPFEDDALAMFARLCDPEHLDELRSYLTDTNPSRLESVCNALSNRFYDAPKNNPQSIPFIEFLTPYMFNDDKRMNRDVIKTITEINKEVAAGILLKPEYLFVEQRTREIVLNQIARSNIPLPSGLATKLFEMDIDLSESADILKGCATTWPGKHWDLKLKSLLNALADTPQDPGYSKLQHSMLTDTLSDAVAVRLGYESSFELFNFDGEAGEAGEATPTQRTLRTLSAFKYELSNGGFLQFFFNSAGASWKQTIEAAQKIYSPQVTRLLKQAVATIKLTDTDTTRDAVHKRLEDLSETQENTLDELSSEFYKISNLFKVQIIRYVLEHRSELNKAD